MGISLLSVSVVIIFEIGKTKQKVSHRKVRKKMPHSLRARLSGLRYKKIISDKDYDRLCKALDNEKVLDKIRAEIDEQYDRVKPYNIDVAEGLEMALGIIDGHMKEGE